MLLPMLHSPDLNDLGFRWNKPTDIVSTLVNIYDSRELFIRELSQLFSHRLMDIRDGNLEGEVSSISCTVICCFMPASPETSYRNIEVTIWGCGAPSPGRNAIGHAILGETK